MARFGAGGPSAGFGSRSTGSSSRGSSSRGSSLGDGGGRAANNGGMSASAGSSASSTSNQASPSRSTPGSPSAADGRRGASMGPTGGSAGPATSSSHPGRPGGEANERSFVNTSTSGGSDSIRGSSDARRAYGFDSEKIRDAVVRNREARNTPVTMMDDAPIAPTELNQDVLALVEAQDSPRLTKKSQKARDIQFNTNLPVPDRVALTNKAGENFAAGVQRATDENAGRGLLLGLLSPFAEPAIDLAENYAEARRVNAENAKLAESYGVDPGFIGEVGIGDMTSAAIGESTGGLIGGQNSGLAAITGTKQAAGPRSVSGKGNIQQPVTPPSPIGPTPSPQQAADSGSKFGAGEVNGYASYARRVFSRI